MLLMKAEWTITQELAHACGVTAAVLIEKGAELLGIPPCTKCKQRSQLLREVDQLGFSEFIKRFRETYGTNNTSTSGH